MSPGWQAKLFVNAVGADGGADLPIRRRASQVVPLRFSGDEVQSIVGATFMSPGWQAELCGNAVGAGGGLGVPFRQ